MVSPQEVEGLPRQLGRDQEPPRTRREVTNIGPGVGCQMNSTKGREYEGRANTTASGLTCQAWSASDYPEVGEHNYCRNPDGDDGGVWCYGADGDLDYCPVPWCLPVKVLDFSLDNDGAPDSRGSFTHASLWAIRGGLG